jgi:hypothetical protein
MFKCKKQMGEYYDISGRWVAEKGVYADKCLWWWKKFQINGQPCEPVIDHCQWLFATRSFPPQRNRWNFKRLLWSPNLLDKLYSRSQTENEVEVTKGIRDFEILQKEGPSPFQKIQRTRLLNELYWNTFIRALNRIFSPFQPNPSDLIPTLRHDIRPHSRQNYPNGLYMENNSVKPDLKSSI